jgi:hypothetical protein
VVAKSNISSMSIYFQYGGGKSLTAGLPNYFQKIDSKDFISNFYFNRLNVGNEAAFQKSVNDVFQSNYHIKPSRIVIRKNMITLVIPNSIKDEFDGDKVLELLDDDSELIYYTIDGRRVGDIKFDIFSKLSKSQQKQIKSGKKQKSKPKKGIPDDEDVIVIGDKLKDFSFVPSPLKLPTSKKDVVVLDVGGSEAAGKNKKLSKSDAKKYLGSTFGLGKTRSPVKGVKGKFTIFEQFQPGGEVINIPNKKSQVHYTHQLSSKYFADKLELEKLITKSWESFDRNFTLSTIRVENADFGILEIDVNDNGGIVSNKPEETQLSFIAKYISFFRSDPSLKALWDGSIAIGTSQFNFYPGPAYKEDCYGRSNPIRLSGEDGMIDLCSPTEDLINVVKALTGENDTTIGSDRKQLFIRLRSIIKGYQTEWPKNIRLLFWNRLLKIVRKNPVPDFVDEAVAEGYFRKTFSNEWITKIDNTTYPNYDADPSFKGKTLEEVKENYYNSAKGIEASLKPKIVNLQEYNGLLSDTSIDSALEKLEENSRAFKFVRVRKDGNALPVSDPGRYNGYQYFGTVFNTSQNGEGEHWVASFVSLISVDDYPCVEYADSLAVTPDGRIKELLDVFVDAVNKYIQLQHDDEAFTINKATYFDNPDTTFFKTLKNKKQNGKIECGVYALNFIEERLKGFTFEEYDNMKIPDIVCNIKRDTYFRVTEKRKDFLQATGFDHNEFDRDTCYLISPSLYNREIFNEQEKMKKLSDYVLQTAMEYIEFDRPLSLELSADVFQGDGTVLTLEKETIDRAPFTDLLRNKKTDGAGLLIYTIIENEIHVLLQKRSEADGGYWNIIGGEKDDSDYDMITTAMREFYEESGARNSFNLCETSGLKLIYKHKSKQTGTGSYGIVCASVDDMYAKYMQFREVKNSKNAAPEVDTKYQSKIGTLDGTKSYYLSPGYEWFPVKEIKLLTEELRKNYETIFNSTSDSGRNFKEAYEEANKNYNETAMTYKMKVWGQDLVYDFGPRNVSVLGIITEAF